MRREEIMKELDKFEIPYEPDANKPVLQKLLDDELAARAAGENDQPPTPDPEPKVVAEPEISDEERQARYEAAAKAQAKAVAAREAADAEAKAAAEAMGKYASKGKQVSLAEANKHFQAGVRRDNAIKVQTSALMARFAQEAEEMLDTAGAE